MVLSAVRSAVARRPVVTAIAKQQQKRTMGGGGGPAPEWTGIDKTVRSYFPEDYQLAGAIITGYFVLIGTGNIIASMGSKKKPEAVPAGSVPTDLPPSTGVPSVESPEFEKYVETDAFIKMVDSDDQLTAALAD